MVHRRAFLATLATAPGLLAGCVGAGESGGGSKAGLRLESLDVGGSPGGRVRIQPPERVALLDFFATWCAPCKPEMANLRAARARFSPESVFMVSITPETDEAAVAAFWRRYDGTWPVAMDPDLAASRAYDVKGVPTIIVLTPDGREVWRHRGLAGEERVVRKLKTALREA